jgi:hypothetical protein
MTDRMGEFTSSLNRLSKPNSTAKPQVKPTKSSRGGGSSAQNLGSSSGTRGYQVGGGQGYGISGIKLADSYDLYDIILSHLIDEGYADTQQAAEAIMVNMSEEWREDIVEEVFNEGYKRLPRIKMAKQMLRKASSAFKGAHKTGIEGDSPETTGGQIAVQKGMKKMKQAYKMHDVATGHSAERSKSKEKENKSPIKKSGSTITIGLRKGGSSSDGRTITIGGKGENSQSKSTW